MFQQTYTQKTTKIAVAIFLAFSGFSHAIAVAQDCDRSCLAEMVTQYIDALLEHDPSKLPLADNVRFTEDSRALKPGQGLWLSPCNLGRLPTLRS